MKQKEQNPTDRPGNVAVSQLLAVVPVKSNINVVITCIYILVAMLWKLNFRLISFAAVVLKEISENQLHHFVHMLKPSRSVIYNKQQKTKIC